MISSTVSNVPRVVANRCDLRLPESEKAQRPRRSAPVSIVRGDRGGSSATRWANRARARRGSSAWPRWASWSPGQRHALHLHAPRGAIPRHRGSRGHRGAISADALSVETHPSTESSRRSDKSNKGHKFFWWNSLTTLVDDPPAELRLRMRACCGRFFSATVRCG